MIDCCAIIRIVLVVTNNVWGGDICFQSFHVKAIELGGLRSIRYHTRPRGPNIPLSIRLYPAMVMFTSRNLVLFVLMMCMFRSNDAIKLHVVAQVRTSPSIGRRSNPPISGCYNNKVPLSKRSRSLALFASPFLRKNSCEANHHLTNCKSHSELASYSSSSNTHDEMDGKNELQILPKQQSQQPSRYHLTIVIPAYNERNRIGTTLSTYMNVLSRMPVYQGNNVSACSEMVTSGSVSILVVDDGSTDGTAEYIRSNSWRDSTKNESEKEDCWNVDQDVVCISLSENAGKGAAIEQGMAELSSFGPESNNEKDGSLTSSIRSIVLVADADGSGDMVCIDNMLQSLEELLSSSCSTTRKQPNQSSLFDPSSALVVGYRQYPESKGSLRALLSWGFRTCVSSIFLGRNLGVRDTQCGFKLMTASTGKMLYNELNLRRWTHDVEVVHRARLLGVPVGECGVSWVDKEGSKLVTKASDAVVVSLVMLSEIAKMRIKYALGMWKAQKKQ